jgi:hypothetical protein
MMRRLAAFLVLPAPERLLLVQLWFRLLAAYLALRRWPMERARQTLNYLPGLIPREVSPERMAALADIAVRRALRPAHCLERCLALESLLRRQGLSPDLRIGACRVGDGLKFHAWLEYKGAPIGEPAGTRDAFQPLDSVPVRLRTVQG